MKHRRLLILVVAGLPVASLSPASGAVADGLLNYWNFEGNLNDTAGTAVGSTSSVNDNGTAAGAVTIQAAGPLGQFGRFQLGHVVVPNSPDILAGGESLTLSAWFRVEAFTAEWQALIAHGEGSDYRIARRTTNPVMSYAGGTGDIPAGSEGPDCTDGLWHQVVAISEAGVSSRIWVDGALVSTGGAPTLSNNGSANLWIGGNPDTGTGRDWNGDIDDVAMWDRPLTDEEIGQIHTQGLTGMPLSSFFVINTLPAIGPATLTGQVVSITFTDSATSQVDVTKTRSMLIDGVDASPTTITKDGAVTTLSYSSPTPYDAGSLHTLVATVTTTNNTPVTGNRNFRAPFVSILVKNGGTFDTQHIWTHGNPQIAGSAAAAEAVLDDPGAYLPEDQITAKTPFIHFHDDVGPPLYGPESKPYPLWDPANGGTGFGARDDFAIRSRGKFNISKAGMCYFICNSDDGFALRVDGVELGSAGDRARGNTVMSADLAIGPHDVECVHWERGGGAGVSVFFHKGVSDTEPPFDEGAYELLEAWLDPTDSDGDGMSDLYETENGLNPAVNDAAGDLDADTLTNLTEYQLNTRANKADTDDDGLNDPVETGTGTYVSPSNTGTNPRIRDTDGDTLGDAAETNTGSFVSPTNAGTSPFNPDTDGDTLIDGAEVTLGSNPVVAGPVSVIEGGGTWTTEHVYTRSNPTMNLASAEEALNDPSVFPPEDSITKQTQFIHCHDDVAPPWFVPQSTPYPLWDPIPGFGNREDFALRSRGTIKITQAGMVWFNCNSDDGFSLRIDGTEVGAAGDRGRSDTVMSADLTAGTHEVEFVHWERGGGAGVSVLVYRAITDTAPVVSGDTWQLLQAFATAPTSTLTITSYSYNPTTTVLNLTFTSEVGSNYALEYTTGFQPAGAPTSAAKWNVVPGYGSIPGAAGTTSIPPLTTSTLVTPGGQLPDNTQVYVRVRKL